MNSFKLPYNITFEYVTESTTIRAFRLTKHLPIIFESDMLSMVHCARKDRRITQEEEGTLVSKLVRIPTEA